MTPKGKRRLKKSLAKRKKDRLNRAFRNLFVKSGFLEDYEKHTINLKRQEEGY